MNLKKIIISSLLLAIGMVLHQIVPPILLGMKPDLLLGMLFIAIAFNDDYKMTVLVSLAAGILTAATTTFPGGQIPNIIDKLITGHCVFLMFRGSKKFLNHQIQMGIISVIGTLISGTVFLGSALLLFGLPAPFTALMVSVVIPATLVNTVGAVILYNAVHLALKRTAY